MNHAFVTGKGMMYYWRVVIAGTALLALMTLALHVSQACSHCNSSNAIWSSVGFGFYVSMLWLSFTSIPFAFLMAGLTAAVSVHVTLLFSMLQAGHICTLCWAVALGCFAATILGLLINRHSWIIFALMGPLSIGTAFGLLGGPAWVEAHELPKQGKVRLYVYEKAGCPSCAEFKHNILPQLSLHFGHSLEIESRTLERPHLFIGRLPFVLSCGYRGRAVINHPLDIAQCELEICRTLQADRH